MNACRPNRHYLALLLALGLSGCGPAGVAALLTAGGGSSSSPEPAIDVASYCAQPVLIPGNSLPLKGTILQGFEGVNNFLIQLIADCDQDPTTTGDQVALYDGPITAGELMGDGFYTVPIPPALCGALPITVGLEVIITSSGGISAQKFYPSFFQIRDPDQFLIAGQQDSDFAEDIISVGGRTVWAARYAAGFNTPLKGGGSFSTTNSFFGSDNFFPKTRSVVCGLDANCEVEWVIDFPSSGGTEVKQPTQLGTNRFVVQGQFQKDVTIQTPTGPLTLTHQGGSQTSNCELFWSVHTADGTFQKEVHTTGASSCNNRPRTTVARGVQGSGGFIATARISGPVSFQGQFTVSGTQSTVTNPGGEDSWIGVFDPEARVEWQVAQGGPQYDCPNGVALSTTGLVLVSGEYHGPQVKLGSGPETIEAQTWESSDEADWRYDAVLSALSIQDGTLVWHATLKGIHKESGGPILATADRIYWAGTFQQDIQPKLTDAQGNVRILSPTAPGSQHAFLATFDFNGTLIGNPRVFSASQGCSINTIELLPDGDLALGGQFSGRMKVDDIFPELEYLELGPPVQGQTPAQDIWLARVRRESGFPVVWTWHGGGPDAGGSSLFGGDNTDRIGGMTLLGLDTLRLSLTSTVGYQCGIGSSQCFSPIVPAGPDPITSLLLVDLNLDGTVQFGQ